MPDITLLPFALPAIKPKKVVAAFDGGRLSSNGGVALLAFGREAWSGIIDLANLFPDDRDQERVIHPMDSMLGRPDLRDRLRFTRMATTFRPPAQGSGVSNQLVADCRTAGMTCASQTDDLAARECAVAPGHYPADLCTG